MFFLERGYRVIAHDRRGHGRSTQTVTGNEMDAYAADVNELVEKLDLRDVIHIGHSTGGGEVSNENIPRRQRTEVKMRMSPPDRHSAWPINDHGGSR